MVIDFHTHAFPDAIAPRAIDSLVKGSDGLYPPCSDGTLAGLRANMKKFGVDLSVLQPVVTKPSQTKSLNEWAKAAISNDIISFGGIHPHTDDYKRDIDFVVSLGLKGIKLHPEYQDFIVDSPEMMRIYDYAFSQGLIILQHAGFDPAFKAPFRSSPEMFARVVKAMPGGKMVVAHLGGQQQWDLVEKHLVGLDVYLDTSMGQFLYPKEQFLRIVSGHGSERILFGSDAPWSRAGEEIESIRSLPLSDEEKENILGRNAAKLLGIEA